MSSREQARSGLLFPGACIAAVVAVVFARRRTSRTTEVPRLPGDDLPHDGSSGTRKQLVLLEGGPSHGAHVPVAWGAAEVTVQDENRVDHHYRLTSATSVSPGGDVVHTFLHADPQPSG